jgi:hypothetical protein
MAAGTLSRLAANPWNAVAISIAGAISPLVQLLGHGSPADVQTNVVGALGVLSQYRPIEIQMTAAGVIPALVLLVDPESGGSCLRTCMPESPFQVQKSAAMLLRNLQEFRDQMGWDVCT